MIAVRLDRQMAARVDASDIVQEALTEAAGRLSDYVSNRPLPFYPWLRHIAWQHLLKSRQRHIGAQRRSVAREQRELADFNDESAARLADRLVADDTSPSGQAIRSEERERVRAALALLPARDHEVLVLRHLELLSPGEIGAVLGLSTGAVMTRHTRALERLARSWSWAERRKRRERESVRNRSQLAAGECAPGVKLRRRCCVQRLSRGNGGRE